MQTDLDTDSDETQSQSTDSNMETIMKSLLNASNMIQKEQEKL